MAGNVSCVTLTTTGAATIGGAATFNAGAVIAASQALTGTAANSTISGFLSIAATTGTFTNVGGTLSTAAQPNVTSLGTIAALVAGTGSFSGQTLLATNTGYDVGVGVTPSAWFKGGGTNQWNAVELPGGSLHSNAGATLGLMQNAYASSLGGFKKIATGYASWHYMNAGTYVWNISNAGAGLAGDTITWTQVMSTTAAGAVTIPGALGVTGAITGSAGISGTTGRFSGQTLSVGTTAQTFNAGTSWGGVEFSRGEIMYSNTDASNQLYISSNIYFGSDTDWHWRNTAVAAQIGMASGVITLSTAASGTADAGMGSALSAKLTIANAGQATWTDYANTSAFAFETFVSNSATAGSITRVAQTAAVTFNTTSDERLKTDLGIATDTSVLRALKIHDFEWKENGVRGIGVFAQEAHKVWADPITVGGDDPKTKPWGAGYSTYVPHLIVGWQDHERRLLALESAIKR